VGVRELMGDCELEGEGVRLYVPLGEEEALGVREVEGVRAGVGEEEGERVGWGGVWEGVRGEVGEGKGGVAVAEPPPPPPPPARPPGGVGVGEYEKKTVIDCRGVPLPGEGEEEPPEEEGVAPAGVEDALGECEREGWKGVGEEVGRDKSLGTAAGLREELIVLEVVD